MTDQGTIHTTFDELAAKTRMFAAMRRLHARLSTQGDLLEEGSS